MLYGDYFLSLFETMRKLSPYDIQLKLRNILKHGFEDTNIILSQQYDLYATKNNFRLQVNKDDFILNYLKQFRQEVKSVQLMMY